MEEHQKAMDKVRELLISPMIRTQFDPKLSTILECDSARRTGMGYALMQKHGEEYKFVEAESRWLSQAEKQIRYDQLRISWGLLGNTNVHIIFVWTPLVENNHRSSTIGTNT